LTAEPGQRIEDYALIGNTRTAALVGRNGSIDWFCVPRFDSPACFAALLGTHDNGRWLIAPRGKVTRTHRRYRDKTLVLETTLDTATGSVRIVDCMPLWGDRTDVIRLIEGVRGKVSMHMELVIRCGYGLVVPWVRRIDGALVATAGPDSFELRTPAPMHGKDFTTVAGFSVAKGERLPFVLSHFPSHEPRPVPIDADAAIQSTEYGWHEWCARSTYNGRFADEVTRSLITLKALTYAPTGGIVAAVTTSLPEHIGSVRNWDYRFCWPRDATFTLYAFLASGYHEEAQSWRQWLLRVAAGRPEDLQTLYGVTGERQLPEFELPWLQGYENSAPVRIGNGAAAQTQLDVYGEVIGCLHLARAGGLDPDADAWGLEMTMLRYLEKVWQEPDSGIWEMRGDKQQFTHSKVMVWVAFDRAVKAIEQYGLEGPVTRWRKLRDRIHDDICERGYDSSRRSFVQYYGSQEVDASLLLIPLVGFLPAKDPRVRGTLAAVQRELTVGGLIARYRTASQVDALPPGEGMFLACSFWLVDNLVLVGRRQEAETLFKRLLSLCNDVGLLAEQYDPVGRRQLGNFPQALTHVALIRSARVLSRTGTRQRQHISAAEELAAGVTPRSRIVQGLSSHPPPHAPLHKARRAPAGARPVKQRKT
jgi:GH15 family glucan-1,4-alpha-glucosidase